MNARWNDFLEENKIIDKCQIGIRRKYRTADHLLALKTIIDCYKLKRNPISTCLIDFKKAYDSLWRETFLQTIMRLYATFVVRKYSFY